MLAVTVVPLPDTPCVRVRLGYSYESISLAGSRFYLAYSGSAPTAANCVTLADDVGSAWNTHFSSLVYEPIAMDEVDVLDIATDSGASGTVTLGYTGSMGGSSLTGNVATNIEYSIARRYRGGKPRMYLPPPDESALDDLDKFSTTHIANTNTAAAAFFAEITALSIGSIGTLTHVNLSYYQGFVNVTNSSGRERAAPKYRATAKSDPVTGYSCKAVVGSQRRRRTSTTI